MRRSIERRRDKKSDNVPMDPDAKRLRLDEGPVDNVRPVMAAVRDLLTSAANKFNALFLMEVPVT